MDKIIGDIDLSQLLSSLSLGLDIGQNRSFEHSRRTAYISYYLSKTLNLDEETTNDIYYAALVHDIGLTGYMSDVSIDEIDHNNDYKEMHCKIGADIVRNLPLSDKVPEYILYHHENWNGKGGFDLAGKETPLGAQIIHVADYFDITFGRYLKEETDIDYINKSIGSLKGNNLNPEITDALLSIMEKDKFWLDLRFRNLQQILDTINPNKKAMINIYDLKKIATAFSMLIDSKSKFTHEHSNGIAKIAKKLAKYMGYDEIKIEKMEIAGYLHDLGKLIVSNSILEKPSSLSANEFTLVKSHPYYTKLMLKQVKGLEDIAEWAGNHHEKLNGNGYPEKLDYKTITNEDQVIAIADIYQALVEDRPYRSGMDNIKALSIMDDMVKKGYISGEMVNNLKNII